MKKFMTMTAAALFVAACSGPSDSEDDGDSTETIDGGGASASGTVSTGDLRGAEYDTADGSLSVEITLDGDAVVTQNYGDGTAYGDYVVYTQQRSPNDRFFTAFAGESADGSVNAVVVSDGGQFNRFFGGATANQTTYSAPPSGIVDYSGEYVGLLNFGPVAGTGTGDAGVPNRSNQVTGEIFLKADFSDNAVNGNIFNREYGPDGTGAALPEVVLVVSDIAENGTFAGSVELTDQIGVGNYEGVFGGDGASSVAGVVALGAGFSDGAIAGADGAEREFGIFVLESD